MLLNVLTDQFPELIHILELLKYILYIVDFINLADLCAVLSRQYIRFYLRDIYVKIQVWVSTHMCYKPCKFGYFLPIIKSWFTSRETYFLSSVSIAGTFLKMHICYYPHIHCK
jgi:hypothetical protein